MGCGISKNQETMELHKVIKNKYDTSAHPKSHSKAPASVAPVRNSNPNLLLNPQKSVAVPDHLSLKAKIRNIFDMHASSNETLTLDEFRNLCTDLGYHFRETALVAQMSIFDNDQNGSLSFNEFYDWYL